MFFPVRKKVKASVTCVSDSAQADTDTPKTLSPNSTDSVLLHRFDHQHAAEAAGERSQWACETLA